MSGLYNSTFLSSKHFRLSLRLILVLLVLTPGYLAAQIADGSLPASFQQRLKTAVVIPGHELLALKPDSLKAIDQRDGVQNRFGLVETMNVDLKEEGVYSELGDTQIWRYRIKCEEVVSLGLQFSTFDIPEGAALYVYSADESEIRGGFTSQNRKASGKLAIAALATDELIIEYDEPKSASYAGGVILGGVVEAYRALESNAGERIQINCPEGADWQDEKRAVCMITFVDGAYSYYCSGALMNNTREDGRALFLTANHCISSDLVASSMITYFNYENSTCSSNDASRAQTLSGAELRANNAYSDFSLVELSEYPPESYRPYFAGWNASGDTPANATSIHHPQGEPKTISLDYDPPVSINYSVRWDDGSMSLSGSHWEVAYDVGSDEGGSSGGPLFDENKQIVGQLHGGDDNTSLFGKFSISWDYRSETDRQLKHWLDPINSNVDELVGLDGYSRPYADFSTEVEVACLSEPVALIDQSRYSPESWQWEISPSTYRFVNGTSASSENPVIQFEQEGVYTVSLTVENEYGADTEVKANQIEVYNALPVSLIDVADEITVCGWELNNYEFAAEGAPYFSFNLSLDEKFTSTVTDNILILTLTEEAASEGSFDTYVTVTGTHGSCIAADSVLMHVIIPSNDNVRQAAALVLGYNGGFSNECGTVQEDEPAPETNGCSIENNWCPPTSEEVLDNSIWFQFEGPSSGWVTIEANGIESQIAVYRAATAQYLLAGSSANYTLMGAADAGLKSAGQTRLEHVAVTPGTSYWLQVDGRDGQEGDISINLLTNSIEVYPNPSSGIFYLTVGSTTSGQADLYVYNQTGQLVYAGNNTIDPQDNTLEFDLSHLANGIYYFRAVINGETMSKKLVLMK